MSSLSVINRYSFGSWLRFGLHSNTFLSSKPINRFSNVWTFGKRNIVSMSLSVEESVDCLTVELLLSALFWSEKCLKTTEEQLFCIRKRLETRGLMEEMEDLFKCLKRKDNLLIEAMILCLLWFQMFLNAFKN